jgi:uncharacterized protein DUF4132
MKLSTEPDWAVHETRASHLADLPLRNPLPLRGGAAWAELLRDEPDEVVGSLLLLQIRSVRRYDLGQAWYDLVHHLPHALGRRRPAVSAADAAWAAQVTAAMPDSHGSTAAMDVAAALALWCDQPRDPGLQQAVEALAATVDAHRAMYAPDRARIRKRLLALRPEVPVGAALEVTMIRPDDGWSRAVREQAARWSGDARGANLLLRHLAAAAGSKPSRRWTEQVTTLLEDPEAAGLLRILVESAATGDNGKPPLLVSEANADLVRAACWAVSAVTADWVIPALHAAAARSMLEHGFAASGYIASAKVPNACVHSLGVISGDDAIGRLLDLQRRVRHAGFRQQIGAGLAVAAERAGLTMSELAERVVPDAGLSPDGERQITADRTTAWVSIDAGGRVRTEWQTPAGRSARRPAEADPEPVSQVRLAVKEVKAALAGERSRLEGLLAEERSWTVADWRRLYLEHPVTGALTRGLIWSFGTGTGTMTGIPADGARLDGPGGQHPIPAEATVALWHPARADTAEVGRWRDYLVASERAQPFRQAFREVYVITPAELETRVYSNRFAAHVLRYQQAYALFKERGWAANYLGPYDGGYEGQARRDFPGAGLTAYFDHYPADAGPFAYPVGLCGTDRVRFCRTGDRRHDPVPLAEIPPLVFSEAMRDVDLFVSVPSIALDPQWADRGEDPHFAYWQQHSFGELAETAVVRREALARLVPKLKIAPRLEIDGRYLRVQGRRHRYKIHIGSGNVLIEPDDRYLCIVPASARSKVMLPFDGDQLLSLVLSKAVLLAADDKITDPDITRQLTLRC